jgi:hypothetical protein
LDHQRHALTSHAWVISVGAFLLVAYLMIRWLAPYMIVGAH